jgi:hypothetical protein
VTLDREAGPFRPCRYCDSAVAVIADGSGPHLAAIRCAGCERHLSWMPKADHARLCAEVGAR